MDDYLVLLEFCFEAENAGGDVEGNDHYAH